VIALLDPVLAFIPRACRKRPLGFFVPPATGRFAEALVAEGSAMPDKNRRIMGKQSQNKFKKRQREFERKRKAKEKMDRRQGKKPIEEDMVTTDNQVTPDEPAQAE